MIACTHRTVKFEASNNKLQSLTTSPEGLARIVHFCTGRENFPCLELSNLLQGVVVISLCSLALDIAFSTKALRRLAESQSLASRKFGEKVAAALHAQLADIDAALNVEELPFGFNAKGSSPIGFALPLADNYVAVFESNHNRDRELPHGTKIMWNRVRRIKLMEIVKTNA